MTRFFSFGGSTALHAGALGAVLLAGAWGFHREPPRAAVAPSRPVALDLRVDVPTPAVFEAAPLPETLPLAEAELEFEAETAVEELDVVPALSPTPDRAAPAFERPSKTGAKIPTASAAEPAPLVEYEVAAVEIHNPPPAYPAAARRRGQEGTALVELRILKDGSIADPVVLECVGSPLFAEAALKAVASWRYQPATLGGVPVDRVHRVRFSFKIQS